MNGSIRSRAWRSGPETLCRGLTTRIWPRRFPRLVAQTTTTCGTTGIATCCARTDIGAGTGEVCTGVSAARANSAHMTHVTPHREPNRLYDAGSYAPRPGIEPCSPQTYELDSR